MVVAEIDEELAVGRVRVLASRRTKRAPIMGDAAEFRRQVGKARPAGPRLPKIQAVAVASVLDIAGLRHETVDHPVEDHAIIGALARQFLHAFGMSRSDVRHQPDRDRALLQLDQDRVFGILEICQ